jgi:eukaryotic-like serine/threonine-protein kinase
VSAPQIDTEPDLRERSISARDPIAFTPGTRIDRYVVLSRLGVGGMGVVLAAYDPQLDRRVALKVLHGQAGGRDTREARRLVREAMAMARLSHPNVITVHDVGEHDGLVYISMELVEGRTLKQRLDQRPPWPEVLELFIAAGRGLAGAHAKGLIHRDFKPDNVMIGDDGRVRVMDFGLAHDAAPDSSGGSASVGDVPLSPRSDALSGDATHADRIAGTPGFIAPELHRGEPADPRSDQFAFGVALYEGLFGRRPFEGESVYELGAAAMAGRVRAIPASSDVPGWVRRIVLRALAPAADDRFAAMDALLEALGQRSVRQHARRRIALALGALAVLGGSAGAVALADRRARAACENDGAAIDALWNPEIRAQTRAGFTADAPAYAVVAWDKAAVWLDRYAQGWHRMRVEACTATNIEQHRSEQLLARSVDCLDGRRRVFEAVVRQLAAGGESITGVAVDAASGLPTLAPCMDDGWLLRDRADDHDESGDPELRELLAEAIALDLAGREREGVELAREASQRAAALGATSIEIDARLQLARGLGSAGDYEPALAESEQAFFLAGRNGDDAAAAESASIAASVAGFDLRRDEESQRWVQLAEMALARLGEPETPRFGACLFDLGRAELSVAHYERAEALLERARAIFERELDPEHPRVASVTVHLGIVAMDRGQYAQAEQLDARALELLERAFGPDHPALASALNNIGGSLDARGQPDRAMPMYERALALWERALGDAHPHYGETLMNIAIVHYERGEYALATEKGLRALALFERAIGPSSPQVASCLNDLVNFTASAGDFAAAERYQQRALEIRETELPPDHPELAGSLAQHGLLVASRSDADAATLARARVNLERALGIWQRKFGDDHPDSAFAHQALGRVLARQGEPDRGLAELEHALKIRRSEDTPKYARAETLFAIARLLRETGKDPLRAAAFASEALELYRAAGETFAPEQHDIESFLATAPR